MRVDGHSHLLLGLTGRDETDRASIELLPSLAGLREGGAALGLVVGGDRAYSLPASMGPWPGTLDMLDRLFEALRRDPLSIGIAHEPRDLGNAANSIVLILHLEGLELLFDSPFEDPRIALRLLYELGVRSVQPIGVSGNHFWEDDLCLTHEAEQILEEVNRLGMVLDLSHMIGSEPAFVEITRTFPGTIVVSHGVLAGVREDSPGLSEQAARAIASSGGLIGIPLSSHHLTGTKEQASVSDFLLHADALVQTIGIDHVGIGTDWLDPARLALPETLFMKGFSDYGDFGILEDGLKAHGYSKAACNAILGENWLRVWGSSL